MEKQISDYTTQELTYEINRRLAMEAKDHYERRTAITNHIRDNVEVYKKLAELMKNTNLIKTLDGIVNYSISCVDIDIMISDGNQFLDAIYKDGSAVWAKYETKENK